MKNQMASLQIFVSALTLYFVKMDASEAKRIKHIIFLVGAVSPWQRIPHEPLRNGREGQQRPPCHHQGETTHIPEMRLSGWIQRDAAENQTQLYM